MAVRSRRLAGPAQVVAGGAELVFTVPSGRTAVVRSIVICSNATAAGEVKVYVGAAATATLVWIVTVPAKSTVVHPAWLALDPNDTLRAKVVTGQQNVTVSYFGALLLGEPE